MGVWGGGTRSPLDGVWEAHKILILNPKMVLWCIRYCMQGSSRLWTPALRPDPMLV